MPLSDPRHAADSLAFIRQADPDRFLASLYAPQEKRDALLSLYAFNVEISSVRERVSQPLPGEMRLQWWRELLEEGSQEKTGGSPVAAQLLDTTRQHALPIQPFLNMLDARIFDLYDDPMPSRNDLEGYCGETASALIQLSALVLNADAAAGSGEMAGHAGCAQAIAGLLRSLPIHRSRGQCYIPLDILNSAGISRDILIAGEERDGISRAISAMTSLGREHLAAFERQAKRLPASLRPAFLPVSLANAYFNRIESRSVDPVTEIAAISPLRLHWLMFRRATSGW